jgi:hypothetical protein
MAVGVAVALKRKHNNLPQEVVNEHHAKSTSLRK